MVLYIRIYINTAEEKKETRIVDHNKCFHYSVVHVSSSLATPLSSTLMNLHCHKKFPKYSFTTNFFYEVPVVLFSLIDMYILRSAVTCGTGSLTN